MLWRIHTSIARSLLLVYGLYRRSHYRFIAPQLAAGKLRARGHGAELGHDDLGVNARAGACGRAEAAIRAGDHVLAAGQARVLDDPLSDQLGVLDKVSDRIDDARDEDLPLRQ